MILKLSFDERRGVGSEHCSERGLWDRDKVCAARARQTEELYGFSPAGVQGRLGRIIENKLRSEMFEVSPEKNTSQIYMYHFYKYIKDRYILLNMFISLVYKMYINIYILLERYIKYILLCIIWKDIEYFKNWLM